MSTRPSRPSGIPDSVFAEAAAWHARLREPDADYAVHEAFQDWLARDPAHLDAYDEAARLWQALGTDAPRDEAAIDALVKGVRGRGRAMRGTALGLALCAVLFGGEWARRGGLDDLRADYVVPVGTQQTVHLADGSTLDINTDTAIAVDLMPGERRVRIFRGEAFFDVARDEVRPFVVETGDGEARVLGTKFNLRVENGATRVSLVEGRVRLSAALHPQGGVDLAPGEAGDITPRAVGAPQKFEADETTAWRRGQVVFFRTPLGDVVEELNRYQRGRILIMNDDLRALAVTGVFDTRDPAAVIDIIEKTLGVSSFRLTDALIVLR